MDFLIAAFKAFPIIAQNPLALIGYVVVILAWLAAIYKSMLLRNNTRDVSPRRINAEQWLRGQRDKYILVAFLFTVLFVSIFFISAILIKIPVDFQKEPDSTSNLNTSHLPPATINMQYWLCVGQYDAPRGCPQGSINLGCNANVDEWLQKECRSYSKGAEAGRKGDSCGYFTVHVACQKPAQ